MADFQNVSIARKANIYFDGKVTSRTITFADGTRKTLGIMLPGDYTFDTAQRELMEFASGQLEVLLPGESEWRQVSGGDAFEVPANSSFQLRVSEVSDYCCSYFAD